MSPILPPELSQLTQTGLYLICAGFVLIGLAIMIIAFVKTDDQGHKKK
jgi:uncharacterized membrane protein